MAKNGYKIFDSDTHVGPVMGVLMYASDYPHGESHFPKSVERVLGWEMDEARKRRLFWDNAVRLYARCGLQ